MKILFDTNVLIGLFRHPDRKADFVARTSRPLLFMSSVVAMELMAGCRTAQQKRELVHFLRPFEKAERLVTPDHAGMLETGRVLAKLGEDGIGLPHRRQMVNDILIAVSAARAGVVVVTGNSQDFSRIARHTPMRWMNPGFE